MFSEEKRFRFLLITTIAMLIIGSIRGSTNTFEYFELQASSEVLKETVVDLEDEVKELELEIMRIKNSPNYAYKILRDKYHVTEENEKIIFFED